MGDVDAERATLRRILRGTYPRTDPDSRIDVNPEPRLLAHKSLGPAEDKDED